MLSKFNDVGIVHAPGVPFIFWGGFLSSKKSSDRVDRVFSVETPQTHGFKNVRRSSLERAHYGVLLISAFIIQFFSDFPES